MTDEELLDLATKITKGQQSYFWSPERQGERTKITKALNILKWVKNYGYEIVKTDDIARID